MSGTHLNMDRSSQPPKEPSRGQIKRPAPRCKTCTACRGRKVKCNGGSPQCIPCSNTNRRCVYPQDARSQNKPTRAEIQRLEAHIESIWAIVREREGGEAGRNDVSPQQAERTVSVPPVRRLSPAAKSPEPERLSNAVERSHQDLSPAEMDIVGVLGQDGELVVHGVSSMHYKQQHQQQPSPGADSTQAEDERTRRERKQQQQISKARLVANAAFQRQRESVLLHNPSLMQQVNFGSIDPETALHLLDLHFNRLHFTYLISYRPAIMDSLFTNGPHCNMLFLTAVYFCSSMFTDRLTVRAQRDQFYASFRLALVDSLDQPSISSAVGLLLCGAALVSSGRLSAGWITSGIAYRMILDLGCHLVLDSPRRDLPDDMILLTDLELEMRKRLYWGAYLIDATQSLYLGRPPYLRAVPARVPQLFLDTYEELDPWSPYLDPLSPLPEVNAVLGAYAPRPAYAVSTFTALLKLFEVSSQLVHSFYQIDSVRHPRQHIQDTRASIAKDLYRWYESREEHLRFNPLLDTDPTPPPHQITPLTTYHTLTILLHRPFLANGYLSAHITEDERTAGEQASVQAAIQTYHLIKRYESAFTLRRAPYLISYAVHSALLALLTQKPVERDCVLDKIGFLWGALGDLQGGGNCGLKKPMENLADWMAKLGLSFGAGGLVGGGRGGGEFVLPGGDGMSGQQGNRIHETDLIGNSVMDWTFPNSGLEGVDWLLNDMSWIAAGAGNDASLQQIE
ncbi:hypothetical protein BDW59DRAFT_156322 [Aspergillus cavernicola]|uniref:Zn(2)-C6 fungal-type domain-containing protein n=1 Tax=Aspergillus cavernicola TaxID=176166 RepID=A0ABR4J323_9EURO